MKESLVAELQQLTKASSVKEVELIQTLWSGYGELSRYALSGTDLESVIIKNIILPIKNNHPRGWNTNLSHQRKLKSYQVEVEWYKNWSQRCNEGCRVPHCYRAISAGEEHIIILEDLDASGFPVRKSSLNLDGVKLGLTWLANFHATFLNESPEKLWKEGTYWHLATRPDELTKMKAGRLKDCALELDKQLANCQFKTIVHGDAKVANFCFSEDMTKLAAVDFQYVGGGCGMKDVVYFLGSCLSENECETYEEELLGFYFNTLILELVQQNKVVDFNALEKEWRSLYVIAWADFTRFLLGWMPTHHKVNGYSKKMVKKALVSLMNKE